MEETKLPSHLVRNAGVYYVCHRLSQMGWNATPTTRYAKSPNALIESQDPKRPWEAEGKEPEQARPGAAG